ncbi:MAG: hypothetical protein DRP13_01955 [Candidatus Aenigmatarchaeota archaeon]|nr:MAG: hypothetical protein DRP13_01955 [Candidatus Aenigmarchaeota archaeon]
MKQYLILFLVLIIFTSGCVTETGQTIRNTTIKHKSEQQNHIQTPANTSFQNKTKPEPKCPESCDDKNPCTKDVCSEKTRYLCQHYIIKPCCANQTCNQTKTSGNATNKPAKSEQTQNKEKSKEKQTKDECVTDSDCKDSDPCTEDACSGSPKKCMHTQITSCVPNDNCCPENCDCTNDKDCCPLKHIFISEIMYNPKKNDKGREWIEIYNPGEPVNVSKWRLYEGGTNHKLKLIKGSLLIENNAYAVICDNFTAFLHDYPDFSGTLIDSSFSLKNSGEYLALKTSPKGEIIDESNYTGVAEEGFSIIRTKTGWKQGLEKGTPGY